MLQSNTKSGSRRALMAILVLVLGVVIVLAVGIGAVNVTPAVIVKIILSRLPGFATLIVPDWAAADDTIIWYYRMPRVILAALSGASLAVAGTIFQGLFRNPMADPYVIGVSSGAALGAAIAIVFSIEIHLLGLSAVPILAFAGSLLTIMIVYRIAKRGNRVAVLTLLLAGIAIGALLSSMVSLLMFLGGEKLHQLVYWLMGSFSGRHWNYVITGIPYFVIGLGVALFYARDLNAMLLGEEPAQHLGINVENVKKVLLVVATLLTSTAVASGGIIAFVGLIIPHIVRMMVGPDHRVLLPAVVLVGAIALVLADVLARTVMAPEEIPVGIITTFCGVPFFIYLLRRSGKTGVRLE